jgi:hypothetical protein
MQTDNLHLRGDPTLRLLSWNTFGGTAYLTAAPSTLVKLKKVIDQSNKNALSDEAIPALAACARTERAIERAIVSYREL